MTEVNNTLEIMRDKICGSLVGGAIGDALGYPVEFISSYDAIQRKYGAGGIVEYDLDFARMEGQSDKALFTDDTQMSLYTLEGLLEAEKNGKQPVEAIAGAYLAWYGKQTGRNVKVGYNSELAEIEEFNRQRAPGGTCLSALYDVAAGKRPDNDSKGCGGVMRVAPIGLYGSIRNLDLETTAKLAGEAAEITHKHPLSTYSSAAFAVLCQLCVTTENIDASCFEKHVLRALDIITKVYGYTGYTACFAEIIRKAIALKSSRLADWEVIEHQLGGGWVAEETLAIAIFSVLRHINSFRDCMVCAVNHGGDSDSTGAVAGNLLGAIIGYAALPAAYTTRLQLLPLLLDYATRLHLPFSEHPKSATP